MSALPESGHQIGRGSRLLCANRRHCADVPPDESWSATSDHLGVCNGTQILQEQFRYRTYRPVLQANTNDRGRLGLELDWQNFERHLREMTLRSA